MPVGTALVLRNVSCTGAVATPTFELPNAWTVSAVLPKKKTSEGGVVPAPVRSALALPPGEAMAISLAEKSPVVLGSKRTPTSQLSLMPRLLLRQPLLLSLNWVEFGATVSTPVAAPP